MSEILWLGPEPEFPDPATALEDPNGLLAVGGDLSPERLIQAYRSGIFPWFDDNQPLLWWSPDPRCVLFPDQLHLSKSLRKALRKNDYTLSFDQGFEGVIHHCAATRKENSGTWITEDMHDAYCQLHNLGIAHSVEVWNRDKHLVGGLYGIAIGRCFFGESMFSLETNTSKMAFAFLAKKLLEAGYQIIDCQVENPHLFTLGATTIPRQQFLEILRSNIDQHPTIQPWKNARPTSSAAIVDSVMVKTEN